MTLEAGKPRTTFQIRLTPEELACWKSAAEDRDEPLSALVRRAVEAELEPGFEQMLEAAAGARRPFA